MLILTDRLQKHEGEHWWLLVGTSSLLFRFSEATSTPWRFLFLSLSFSCPFFSFQNRINVSFRLHLRERRSPFRKAFSKRLKDTFPRQSLGIRRPVALRYTLVSEQHSGHEDCQVKIDRVLFLSPPATTLQYRNV